MHHFENKTFETQRCEVEQLYLNHMSYFIHYSIMWASNCPDFGSRRPHEFENVQIREGSCSLRIIRVASLTLLKDLQEYFSAFGRNIGRGEKNLWHVKELPMDFPMFWVRVASGTVVWPQCGLRVAFGSLRVSFVWPMVPFCIFLFPEATRTSRRSFRRPHELAFVFTSCVHLTINRGCPGGVPKASKVNTISA